MSARWNENRKISKRIVVTGCLTQLTPALLGGGQSDRLVDMPLLRDPLDGRALLTGASLAGAIRAYLREWGLGYEQPEPEVTEKDDVPLAQILLGRVVGGAQSREEDRASYESYLIIEDAYAKAISTEFRPGVKINPKTRTVDEQQGHGQLFDMELLEAGTQFPLCFELALPEDEQTQSQLLQGLAIALTGLERGEIALGARKRRGLGECQVTNWHVQTYDLKQPEQLVAWLEGQPGQNPEDNEGAVANILGVKELPPDMRKRFCMEARLRLDTTLLIRSSSEDPRSPDMTHLKSKQNGVNIAIVSGTSLAGALRARALRIANTVAPDRAQDLVAELFGPAEIKPLSKRGPGEEPWASRALIRERRITGTHEHVQSRIRIDRFTGGTHHGALFEQQPVVGRKKEPTEICVSVELRNPADEHIGLLLHILKDLWTCDLPLGGEASVGRGRMHGLEANLSLHVPGQEDEYWTIVPDNEALQIEGNKEKLNKYAKSVGGAQ